ncbi:MAG TPA: glycosyltransferase 87 family protein [Kofleriaceae bacterium]|nr:glycosyltransferase 87 family protein [Kofleriaceae bacterium]
MVFGLFNTCATHAERARVERDIAAGAWSAALVVQAARSAGTDDGDIARYLAYANAILGRPYAAYYVRPAAGWRADDIANDPARSPVVTSAPLVPYRDFSVEYPPGFFALALLPAAIASSDAGFALAFSLWMGLLLTGAVWLAARTARRLGIPDDAVVRLSALAALAVGVICVRRFDAVVAISVCGLVFGVVSRRPWMAGLLFGLGIAAKGIPLLVAPFPIVVYVTHRRWRELAIAAAAAIAVVAAALLPFVDAPLVDMLRYHGERPIQVESTWGALLAIASVVAPVQAKFTYGSLNVVAGFDGPLRAIASALPVAAWLALIVHAVRGPADDRRMIRLMAVAIALYMVLGKVFSPQYLTWLLPAGVLASLTAGRAEQRLFLAAMLATQLIYPLLYLTALPWTASPLFGAVVLVRNGLLAVWAVRLVRAA